MGDNSLFPLFGALLESCVTHVARVLLGETADLLASNAV